MSTVAKMREESKLRKEDERISELVSELLDKHFYTKFKKFARIDNFILQTCGIDTVFSGKCDKKYLCDEKAAVQWINKPLHTYAFEVSYINRANEIQKGWLLDEHMVNNIYLCIYIDEAKVTNPLTVEDFVQLTVIAVEKQVILGYFESIGFTKEKLLAKANKIRNNYNEPLGDIQNNGCRFVISRGLVEQPVNVLISRQILMQLATYSKVMKKGKDF